jgi:hypothetical protein
VSHLLAGESLRFHRGEEILRAEQVRRKDQLPAGNHLSFIRTDPLLVGTDQLFIFSAQLLAGDD